MYARTIIFTFAATLATFASAASPPGCLLGAVNTYKDPSDLSAVCKDKDASGKVAKYCGDDAEIAWEAFVEICKSEGVTVSDDLPTSTASASKTGSASATGTGAATGYPSASGTPITYPNGTIANPTGGPGGPAPSTTQTGGPIQQTDNAAGRFGVAAGAVVAGLGAFAALL